MTAPALYDSTGIEHKVDDLMQMNTVQYYSMLILKEGRTYTSLFNK